MEAAGRADLRGRRGAKLMATLGREELRELLAPYVAEPAPLLLDQLSTYLDLLLKWNGRTNLTAVRDPREIVRRHFGESLFAGGLLPAGVTSVLDLGSGAGFPGIPMQLLRAELEVTLAESQNKKASFLREAVRVLGLKTEVWGARVEELPAERLFGVVTLRAVDNPGLALELARKRTAAGGAIVLLAAEMELEGVREKVLIPGSDGRFVWILNESRT